MPPSTAELWEVWLSRHEGSVFEELVSPCVPLLRDTDATELGRLSTRGVEDNTPRQDLSRLIPGLLRMGEMFAQQKRLNAGDTFSVDWQPGTGAVVTVRGRVQGEPFREPEFFNALLRIWLGPQPADWRLKELLLGKPA